METYTLRHSTKEEALPVRRMEAFLPGEGMGGAANHWNGHTWRWAEYDPILRTHLVKRYGAKAIPAEMSIQDWGVTYAEMEPYHDLFEKLFGIAGKAGNIKGQNPTGRQSVRSPAPGRVPAASARDHRGRVDLQGRRREARLHALPTACGQFARRLYQSGRHEARALPVLRALRALHLRSPGEGHPRACFFTRCSCRSRASSCGCGATYWASTTIGGPSAFAA